MTMNNQKKRKTIINSIENEIFDEGLRERRLIVNEVCFVGKSEMDWGKDVNMHYFLVRFDSSTKLAIIGVEENHNNNTAGEKKYKIYRLGWVEIDDAELIASMQFDTKNSSLYLLIATTKDNGYDIQVKNYEFNVDVHVQKVSGIERVRSSNVTISSSSSSSSSSTKKATTSTTTTTTLTSVATVNVTKDDDDDEIIKIPSLFTLKSNDLLLSKDSTKMLKELNSSLKEMWTSVKAKAVNSNNNNNGDLSTVTQKYYGMRKRKHTLQIDLLALP